jgi:hypothetical protein
MRRSWTRLLAVPAVAVGIAAGATIAAPAAFAASDTGGTVKVTVPFSYIVQLAKAGVIAFPVPASELSVDKTNQTATVTFTVTGGDGDTSTLSGQVNLSGTVVVAAHGRVKEHEEARRVILGSLDLNVLNGDIEGTPAGSSTPVALLDAAGAVSFSSGAPETYDATGLTVDPAGAAYLNSALHSSAFVAGQNVGSLAASWTFA